MNQKLQELYNSKWNDLSQAFKPILENDGLEIKPANPLLLFVNEKIYEEADIRVMFIGKETNGWGIFNHTEENKQHLLTSYNNFFNNEDFIYHGGQFWNGFRRFKTLLESQNPDKKIAYVWNNIVKIGKSGDKGMPPSYIHNIERKHFAILKEEINILKPNIVLFVSGHAYDHIISETFGQLEFNAIGQFTRAQLSKLSLENVDYAFRTYHPGYLYREGIDDYFQPIIDQIKY